MEATTFHCWTKVRFHAGDNDRTTPSSKILLSNIKRETCMMMRSASRTDIGVGVNVRPTKSGMEP